ncbi:hypothetical protein [Aestuariibacter salexigens]|uniref:hypothetical protein n=1 Tax=Aestuariibacter salexigens TaxID=226010 RepID=UPI000416465E|nr:hypothetical protein [Aestuariibacter salexigens]
MGRLYLHVGQDKTGSSFIQSFLAKNHNLLAEKGFYYPVNQKIETASVGKISSGNESLYNLNFFQRLHQLYDPSKNLFFSGERFFRRMPTGELDAATDFLMSEFGINSIDCLLFIRNPLEHMQSAYQQAVKRGGYTDSIENFSKSYRHTKRVYEFVKYCADSEIINLKIINYSSRKKQLLDEVLSWLGVSNEGFHYLNKTINRSLTRAELEFQKLLNEKLGKAAGFLSDAFCQKLPEIRSESVLISERARNNALNNVEKYCLDINAMSEQLNNGSDTYDLQQQVLTQESDSFAFTPAQMKVIVDEMFENLIPSD